MLRLSLSSPIGLHPEPKPDKACLRDPSAPKLAENAILCILKRGRPHSILLLR